MMSKNTRVISVIARVIAAGLLFWALERHTYDYYTLLRWVVCGTCAFVVYIAAELEKNGWIWIMGIIGLLFNPIIPVHLSKSTWQPIDVVAGIVLLVSIPLIKETKN